MEITPYRINAARNAYQFTILEERAFAQVGALSRKSKMSHQVHTYTELKRQIHDDLRAQHPEWIEPTGECPKCEEHEALLRKLLEKLTPKGSNAEASENNKESSSNLP